MARRRREPCPLVDLHSPDYGASMDEYEYVAWENRQLERFEKAQCDGCGLYVIWVPLDEKDRVVA